MQKLFYSAPASLDNAKSNVIDFEMKTAAWGRYGSH